MKKLTLLLLITSSLFSALPPFVQSNRELNAILGDPQLQELGPYPIELIQRVEGGYVISTKQKEVRVDVEYLSSTGIGPAKFRLVFHEPIQK